MKSVVILLIVSTFAFYATSQSPEAGSSPSSSSDGVSSTGHPMLGGKDSVHKSAGTEGQAGNKKPSHAGKSHKGKKPRPTEAAGQQNTKDDVNKPMPGSQARSANRDQFKQKAGGAGKGQAKNRTAKAKGGKGKGKRSTTVAPA